MSVTRPLPGSAANPRQAPLPQLTGLRAIRGHIDVHDDGGDLEALVQRLELLGASRLNHVDQGPAGRWWVLQDPEGNEFCAAA